jgi:MFS transporter, PPP family, 3-phenylpropionic acid transporter
MPPKKPFIQHKTALWPFSFFFLFYAAVAAHGPYRVLYFQSRSFSGVQIGLLSGIAPLITLVTLPLITGLADRTNKHRTITTLSLLVVIVTVAAYPTIKNFTVLFILTVLASTFFSAVLSLANSATMFMLGERKDRYSRIRLGGTIGFSLVAVLAGTLVEQRGLTIAFFVGAALFFATLLVSLKLVHGEEESENSANWRGMRELIRNPHFLLFLLIGLVGGISFTALQTFFFPYMKSLGARESLMGLSLTIGTFAEVPILFFAGRFIKRFSAYKLMVFSLFMTALRLLLLGILANPALILFVQLLSGFNFPLLTVAGVTHADDLAPKGFRATAQGLFNTAVSGVGTAIGGITSGLLFENLGAKRMYLGLCLFLILVLVAVSLVRRGLPERKGPQEDPGK